MFFLFRRKKNVRLYRTFSRRLRLVTSGVIHPARMLIATTRAHGTPIFNTARAQNVPATRLSVTIPIIVRIFFFSPNAKFVKMSRRFVRPVHRTLTTISFNINHSFVSVSFFFLILVKIKSYD